MEQNSFRELFKDCSLSKSEGAFLSDKSYKFDTLFFVSNYILEYYSDSETFNKVDHRQECCRYIEETFNLKQNSSVCINYFTEVLNLLEFSNVVMKVGRSAYKLIDKEMLSFISSSFENSYIFLFMLTYYTFKNDGILDLYFTYKKQQNKGIKKELLSNLEIVLCQKSHREIKVNSAWSKMITKYPIIVLGYYYEDYYISRMFNIDNIKITLRHLSMNNAGTRTPSDLIKNNLYLTRLDELYIKTSIKKFLNDTI